MSKFLVLLSFHITIISSHLTVFRGKAYYSNYSTNEYHDHQNRPLLCISDSVNDALVWNNQLHWDVKNLDYSGPKYEEVELSNYPKNFDGIENQCGIEINSPNCFSKWNQSYGSWVLTRSFDVPMSPVYDSRWEKFTDHTGQKVWKPVEIYSKNIHISPKFRGTGALAFSVRGSKEARLRLCGSQGLHDYCYMLKIGHGNLSTLIFRCENGKYTCDYTNIRTAYNPLSTNEWKTFLFTWKNKGRTFQLFDPYKLILSGTDNGYIPSNFFQEPYHLFYANIDVEMLYRFHDYSYILATQLGATLRSPALIVQNSQKFCIDMLIGLCKNCQLIVNLTDKLGVKLLIKTITRSNAYKNIEHDFPIWQQEKIILSDVSGHNTPVTLELIAVSSQSSNNQGNHWAITDFKHCLPDDTIKRVAMTASQDYNSNYFWPEVTCQRLSYNDQNSEIVHASAVASKISNDYEYCSNNQIGPKCASNCKPYFQYNDCYSVAVCNENACQCTQKYDGDDCGHDCKEFPDPSFVPAYCDQIVLEDPPSPKFDHIQETSVRVLFDDKSEYTKIIATFSCEIKSNFGYNQTKNIEKVRNNDATGVPNNIYVVHFTNLTPGIEYSARMIIDIKYESKKNKNIFGKPATFVTLCENDEKFKIIPDERSLRIERTSIKEVYSCSDSWYSVQLSKISSNNNQSQPLNINSTQKVFPITLLELEPSTEYEICIKGANITFFNCQNASTLEAAPSQVIGLEVKSIINTEAEIVWQPPTKTNGILKGYSLTIKVMNYIGCKTKETPESLKITSSKFMLKNDSISHRITNLVPYVTYEVAVVAFNSRIGNKSIINFNTTERGIPTSVFSNLTLFENKISWKDPIDCWTITGSIGGAMIFLSGLSKNVERFKHQLITHLYSYSLDLIKPHILYGNETYRVKIYVLRQTMHNFNDSAYTELIFTTNPSPPPKVQKLDIIEVNEKNRTTTLRWEKLQPPTNGEIDYYIISFVEHGVNVSDGIIVYPNETCNLWNNSLCKTVTQPLDKKQYIEVRAHNKGINEPGEASRVDDIREEQASEAPKILQIQEMVKGNISLKWQHPSITGGPIKKFLIHRDIISTQLEQTPTVKDGIIEFLIFNYKTEYNTSFNLLPSTLYKISVQGMGIKHIGNISSVNIKTNLSLAFVHKPLLVVDEIRSLISIVIPPVIYNTKNSMLHIFMQGPAKCKQEEILNPDLKKDIKAESREIIWHFTTVLTQESINQSYTIGNGLINDDNISNCTLHVGSTYIIFIVAELSSNNNINKTQIFMWKSQPIQINLLTRTHHEYWAVPLVLLSITTGIVSYYIIKKRKEKYSNHKANYEMSSSMTNSFAISE